MFKKLEQEVKENASRLDTVIDTFIEDVDTYGKYVAFHNFETYFEETLELAYYKALDKLGARKGFVIRAVTDEPIVLSSLVKLQTGGRIGQSRTVGSRVDLYRFCGFESHLVCIGFQFFLVSF